MQSKMRFRLFHFLTFSLVLFLCYRLYLGYNNIGFAPDLMAQQQEASPTETAAAATTPTQEETPTTEEKAAPVNPLDKCPTNYSEAEIDILQNLGERRKALERREQELMLRENLLKVAEAKIDGKIGSLEQLKVETEKLIAIYNEKEDQKIKSLVKIYEVMKPKDAAQIFSELDNHVLLMVVSKMKEAKIAPILAQMDPMKAKIITTELAERNKISPIKSQQ